ncbi:transposase [Rhodococcus sp. MALMAid1271]|uniref:transposase n=1 Tax=Rhodococcus sp. MALMAid1271 TaxID=3411744 RepID=UPI003BA03EA8
MSPQCCAIDTARASARAAAWEHAGEHAPDHHVTAQNPIVIDLDAALVTPHSEKEAAAPTYKRGFGFHPLLAFVDHGVGETGEPVAALLRPGIAGSSTAADHLKVIRKALAKLRSAIGPCPGRTVIVRTDGAGASHTFMTWLHNKRVSYSIGLGLTDAMVTALSAASPKVRVRSPSTMPRRSATGYGASTPPAFSTWPTGIRVIIRRNTRTPQRS